MLPWDPWVVTRNLETQLSPRGLPGSLLHGQDFRLDSYSSIFPSVCPSMYLSMHTPPPSFHKPPEASWGLTYIDPQLLMSQARQDQPRKAPVRPEVCLLMHCGRRGLWHWGLLGVLVPAQPRAQAAGETLCEENEGQGILGIPHQQRWPGGSGNLKQAWELEPGLEGRGSHAGRWV